MTDGYTLKGLARHRLDYGPIRLWGSVAFIITAPSGCWRSVPHHVLASAQGYLNASIGIVSSVTVIVSGLIYAHAGQHVYYAMAIMAFVGFR